MLILLNVIKLHLILFLFATERSHFFFVKSLTLDTPGILVLIFKLYCVRLIFR